MPEAQVTVLSISMPQIMIVLIGSSEVSSQETLAKILALWKDDLSGNYVETELQHFNGVRRGSIFRDVCH